MSVTIADLLKLPSLSNAEVVAGQAGLTKIVASVSVLEYAEPTALQDDLFKNNEFYGSEIVITGFVHIKDDVEAQCQTIRRLHEVGEVGLIIYYVGIFLPCIDEKVTKLADELGFSLICMPKNRMDLRYSEVIYEVIEAILKDKMVDTYLVSEMLERISLLPVHQRSMDTVLRMLSDRMTCSFYLVDSDFVSVNQANWPSISNVGLFDVGEYYGNDLSKIPKEPKQVYINRNVCICCQQIKNENALPLHFIFVKENGMMSPEICRQVTEVVQLFVNIWSQSHGNVGSEELVKAILNDEPLKMRRLAEILHIDVKSIEHLILIKPEKVLRENSELQKFNNRMMKKVKSIVNKYFEVSLAGIYNDSFVIFMGKEKVRGSREMTVESILHDLAEQGEEIVLVSNFGLKNTKEVRNAYITAINYLKQARLIYPDKRSVSLQELCFAKTCQDIIAAGEDAVKNTLSVLTAIENSEEEQENELFLTLETYLLDAGSSVTKTAEKLYVHKNTIKYRIAKLNEKFNFPISKMPECYELYKAAAIQRILNSTQK